jgi:glycosyltransferase involved in cell wall biosynthesis
MPIKQAQRKLKIAFIFMPINEIRPPVSLNGISVAGDLIIDEIARHVARSHNVIAYCACGRDQQAVEQLDNVEYRRVSTTFDRWVLSHYDQITRLIGRVYELQPLINSPLWCRQFIGEVLADHALRDCDIVHILNASQFVPLIRARLPKIRIVLHMQCQWLEHLDPTTIERRIRAVDLVLGCSNFIASGVRRRFPSFAERCSYIYNGVDPTLFARPPSVQPKPKRLLFVGRLAPEKGVHILLEAFRLVLAQHPDAHLDLIGPEKVLSREALLPVCNDPHMLAAEPYYRAGAYAELLHGAISELPPGSVSLYNNGMRFTDLVPHYHAASIFVFPSVWEEPFGMPVIEAMASTTPVIATRGGAFPEIIEDGRSGLLVKRADARALAEAILQLMSNPGRREGMARAALQRSSMFAWDRIAEDLDNKYQRLVSVNGSLSSRRFVA